MDYVPALQKVASIVGEHSTTNFFTLWGLFYRSWWSIVQSTNGLKIEKSLTSMILIIRRKINQPGLVFLILPVDYQVIFTLMGIAFGIFISRISRVLLWPCSSVVLGLNLIINFVDQLKSIKVHTYHMVTCSSQGVGYWSEVLTKWSTIVSRRGPLIWAT